MKDSSAYHLNVSTKVISCLAQRYPWRVEKYLLGQPSQRIMKEEAVIKLRQAGMT